MLFAKFKISSKNTEVVAKNTLYAFLIKGFALAITFFSTPVFIRYFNNNEVLGLWYTLLSMLTWFLNFDLGIGNGIRNHLVKAIASGNRIEIKKIISSGFASVGAVTLLLSLIGILIVFNVNLNSLLNVSEKLISPSVLLTSTLMIFAAIMLRFFLTTVSSVFYALQRSAINNFLALCVSILQLCFILLFHYDSVEAALVNVSFAYLVISNLPIIIAGILIFFNELSYAKPHYLYVKKETVNKIMGIGIVFFLCQIAYMIITNTNEFFISHFWNPSATADYSFYYRIVMLLSMMVSLALTPTWSMITKAYAERDYQWLSKLYRFFKISGLGLVVLQFALVPFMQFIMNIWLGKGQITVYYPTAIAFACFGASFIYSSMLSTIVCGLAKMKLQLWCYGTGALLKMALIILIARVSNDWTWVVWSNVFILLPYCILQQIQLNRMFSVLK